MRMLREVAQVGEPVLRQRAQVLTAEEIATDEIQHLIDDMIETMRHRHGAGIAANQVFEPIQVCVIEVGDNPRYPYKPAIPLTVLINPVVTFLTEERFLNYEGCLSVPNLRGVVSRSVGIKVEALDRSGEPFEREVWGLSAGTYQHECDHLEGRLFLDVVEDSRTLCTWEAFDAHYRAAFVERAQALVRRFGN